MLQRNTEKILVPVSAQVLNDLRGLPPMVQIMTEALRPKGARGHHPAHGYHSVRAQAPRNRQPGVSARSKAKEKARILAAANYLAVQRWELAWRHGEVAEHQRPAGIHASSRKYLH